MIQIIDPSTQAYWFKPPIHELNECMDVDVVCQKCFLVVKIRS
jgi:hypothetical protein